MNRADSPTHDLGSILDTVSGPEMMAHMQAFARWTKHAGSEEELLSLRHVQGTMEEYGYATSLILHDAYISLPGKARVEGLGRDFRAIAHSFSRSTAPAGTAAEVVYLGSGSEEEFVAAEVRGKIALIDGIANPAATLRASRAGAVGQVHVSPHEHLHEMCISPVWGSPTHETAGNLPSTVVVTVPFEEGEAIKEALDRSGRLELIIHAEVDTGWRETPILVAELVSSGGDEEEPFVLFTGHHDTWYYGVMDNGGANATMLEVARLCALHRDRWRRGLRVIFWSGHSQGRYSSSTWYADSNWEELETRALVHVNVDSTGGQGNTIVADTTAAAELRGLAREALMAQAEQEFSGRRMGRAGDQSFWGIGVPAIFGNMSEQPASGEANASAAVFGGRNRLGHGTGWWWHTPHDTLDKIDEQILVRDTRIYLHVVWRLLTDQVLPLDYAEHGRYLRSELDGLQKRVGDLFDLGEPIRRAGRLVQRAELLNRHRHEATGERAERLNRCLVDISRTLVPIDYTAVDRFDHDPALSLKAIPTLRPLERLADLEPSSAEFKFLVTGMTRARNKVAWAIRLATETIEKYLADQGGGQAIQGDHAVD
ncbi:MAG: M28 family peptidase [Trueperaceae bacterium]